MNEMRLAVTGAAGRMGRTIVRSIHEMPGVMLTSALERDGSPFLGQDAGALAGISALGVPVTSNVREAFDKADGVIDFSSPEATMQFAAAAADSRIVHVIGTTGFSDENLNFINEASRKTTVIKSANMSLGVNVLAMLVKQVSALLDESFDIEIVEMHHRNKVDAPSGTALMLGREAAEARNVDLREHGVFGRGNADAAHEPRRVGEIGFASLRGGSVICDHTVIFAGPSERIELTHKADERAIFARGAITAALWGRNRNTGLFSMTDVLRDKLSS
jgi:4-hydroxy-tetrahydrodipicolinate reductase